MLLQLRNRDPCEHYSLGRLSFCFRMIRRIGNRIGKRNDWSLKGERFGGSG